MECDKKSYKIYSDGIKDLVGISKRKKQKFRLYKCDKCGNFHIATVHVKNVSNNVKKKVEKYPVKIDIKKEEPEGWTKKRLVKNKHKTVPLATSKLISKEQADNLRRKINAESF